MMVVEGRRGGAEERRGAICSCGMGLVTRPGGPRDGQVRDITEVLDESLDWYSWHSWHSRLTTFAAHYGVMFCPPWQAFRGGTPDSKQQEIASHDELCRPSSQPEVTPRAEIQRVPRQNARGCSRD